MGSTFTRGLGLNARMYDVASRWAESHGLLEYRRRLVGDLEGEVVEIGAGTGLNFPHYPAGTRVFASDLDPGMLARAIPRARGAEVEVALFIADATALPLADRSVDTVVWGLMMCSVPDLAAAFAEVARVLRPGGRLRFIEHVRDAEGTRRAKVQDTINPVWRRVSGGCNCNRRTDEFVAASDFEIRDLDRFMIGRLHVAPHVFVEAVAPE